MGGSVVLMLALFSVLHWKMPNSVSIWLNQFALVGVKGFLVCVVLPRITPEATSSAAAGFVAERITRVFTPCYTPRPDRSSI